MKKLISILCLAVMLMTAAAAVAESHTHVWGGWTVVSAGHSAACTECGEEITAKHVSYSTSANGFSASACVVCGYRGSSRRGDSDEATALA